MYNGTPCFRHVGMDNPMLQMTEDQLGQVKAEVVAEKEACEALKTRVRHLENSSPTITGSVDQSQVVLEISKIWICGNTNCGYQRTARP